MDVLESFIYKKNLETVIHYLNGLDEPITAKQLQKATGVSLELIYDLSDQNRIQLAEENEEELATCVKCGSKIRSGRYCEDCTKSLANEIKDEFRQSRTTGVIMSAGRRRGL